MSEAEVVAQSLMLLHETETLWNCKAWKLTSPLLLPYLVTLLAWGPLLNQRNNWQVLNQRWWPQCFFIQHKAADPRANPEQKAERGWDTCSLLRMWGQKQIRSWIAEPPNNRIFRVWYWFRKPDSKKEWSFLQQRSGKLQVGLENTQPHHEPGFDSKRNSTDTQMAGSRKKGTHLRTNIDGGQGEGRWGI